MIDAEQHRLSTLFIQVFGILETDFHHPYKVGVALRRLEASTKYPTIVVKTDIKLSAIKNNEVRKDSLSLYTFPKQAC
jgi:hypothetical protein